MKKISAPVAATIASIIVATIWYLFGPITHPSPYIPSSGLALVGLVVVVMGIVWFLFYNYFLEKGFA